MLLAAVSLPAAAANWWTTTPALTIGPTVINVKSMGARGDGTTDDTAAIQSAFNALPSTGGTVIVPDGTYMIDATKSITIPSHARLSMWGAAYLTAYGNNAQRYAVVKLSGVNNVEIVGGHIVGERNAHQGTEGQWGYGISIAGSNTVSVHDIAVYNCWGDGIMVSNAGKGSTAVPTYNITLNRVTATNNRRQGMSIGPSSQVYVVNSSFTNSNGLSPQAGIDIEPQTDGLTQQVRIENSNLNNNAGNGLEVHTNVSGLVLVHSTFASNKGYGAFFDAVTNLQITNSTLTQNYLFGIDLASTTNNAQITGNTITYNGAAWFYAHGKSVFTPGVVPRDITVSDNTSFISMSNNTISPSK